MHCTRLSPDNPDIINELCLGDVGLTSINNLGDGNDTEMITSMKMDSSIIDAHDETSGNATKP